MNLYSILARRSIATAADLQRAQDRQLLYGGDLVSNLLEITWVDEQTLAQAISEYLGVEAGPSGVLESQDNALVLLPFELLQSRTYFPLRRDGSGLTMVVAERLSESENSRLYDAAGCKINPVAGLSFRIKQGLSLAYKRPLDARVERLLHLHGLVKSPVLLPVNAKMRDTQTSGIDKTKTVEKKEGNPENLGRMRAREKKRERKRVTPQVFRMVLSSLRKKEAVLDLFFEFSKHYFDRVIFFPIYGESFGSAKMAAAGTITKEIFSFDFELGIPLLFQRAKGEKRPICLSLESSSADRAFALFLRREPHLISHCIPVVVGDQVIAMIYGHDESPSTDLPDEVAAAVKLASEALQNFALEYESNPIKMGGIYDLAFTKPVATPFGSSTCKNSGHLFFQGDISARSTVRAPSMNEHISASLSNPQKEAQDRDEKDTEEYHLTSQRATPVDPISIANRRLYVEIPSVVGLGSDEGKSTSQPAPSLLQLEERPNSKSVEPSTSPHLPSIIVDLDQEFFTSSKKL